LFEATIKLRHYRILVRSEVDAAYRLPIARRASRNDQGEHVR
jgi:hypothetical protein